MGHGRNGVAAHIHPIDRSLVYAPGDDGVAGAVVRVLANPAGAQDVAVTHFEQATFQVIAHMNLHGSHTKTNLSSWLAAARENDSPLRGRYRQIR
ncbi:hypothetical protein D3C78_1333390 [compost metagenome]